MGKTSLLGERQSAVDSSTCQHHWLIETPQGTTSKGHCKKCVTPRVGEAPWMRHCAF